MDELLKWREEFPILERTTYLINNSLGAMPRGVEAKLREYADTWATRGVRAWEESWWDLPAQVADRMGALIGAAPGSISLHQNVTLTQAVITSCFSFRGPRNKVVLVDLEFPSVVYFYQEQQRHGARIEMVRSEDGIRVPLEKLLEAIDEQTLLVPISLVLFRSSCIVNARAIIERAHRVGAQVVLDCFQAAGTVPIDVASLGTDFAVGGMLKWLCGGPGLAFLYVRRHLISKLEPTVTGWFGTAEPFAFDTEHLSYHPTARRFEHGTPPAPAYFLAQGGLDVIAEVTPERIRARQGELTDHVIARADEMGLPVRTPQERGARGGVVNVGVGPEAGKICHALLERDVCTDYRGDGLRISPHFFNTEDDVDRCFDELATLL